MIHMILILAHALAGMVALVFGCIVLRPPASHRTVVFRVYFFAVIAMSVLVVLVVSYDWAVLTAGQRVTFFLLTVLGAYTALRGAQARRSLLQRPPQWRTGYVDHVGFTVISLFDGFTIVAAIDLGAPLPVVLLIGALGIVAGITAINRVKSRPHTVPGSAARQATPSVARQTQADR